jgi:Ca2+-transporting ATPase
MNDHQEIRWHALSATESANRLSADPVQGLTSDEVQLRRKRVGGNFLSAKPGRPAWLRFLLQFHQPLIYILIASGIITAFLGEWVDSGVIFGVVLVNGVIGYLQEAKAENALAALADTMVAEATVVRQGVTVGLPAVQLVPGDVVLLAAGDKVPADVRLLDSRELRIDESSLTGESVPVHKTTQPLEEQTTLAERTNMAYASTMVTQGQARGIVVATGDQTEVGRISRLITSAQDLATPLTRKITRFSHLLLYVILALAAVTVAVGLLRGQSPIAMFMAAVALAVGAIPEGLPAAVTITLAIGVARMAKRRAIIRKLPAVETLGSTTVICSDKTGTLTENQMTVQAIWSGMSHYEVSGTGYAPLGRIVCQDGVDQEFSPALAECLRAGLLCNDSRLFKEDGAWQIQGDPTEAALVVVAVKAGFKVRETAERYPRLDAIPFESGQQYMATLHDAGMGQPHLVYIKGAVEQVLPRCETMLDEQGKPVSLDPDQINRQVEHMAARGLRVLALARHELPGEKTTLHHDDLDHGLIFLGLQGMIDPPRQEAVAAVAVCRRAGIRVKMITGDHPATAVAIAGQIGLYEEANSATGPGSVLTGTDLEQVPDNELPLVVEETDVFARATPEEKIRLVRALQKNGHVVAMTGDGVNDAPALKQADIGVAMGITGTDVAREAADMVLTDDNFSSIEAAVEEGRGVFDNLTKFIVWTLPTNLGEGLVIMAAIFLGVTLPILPVQILWINMTTAGFLGLMLAFEPREPGIMERPPRNPDTPILTGELITRILLVGTLLLIGAFGLFGWERAAGASLAYARTVAVNAFVIMELFYLFNCRSLSRSILELGFFTNRWVFGGALAMLILQLIYTYAPFMNRLFQSTPIDAAAWARIFAAGFITYLVVELEKKLRQRQETSLTQPGEQHG